MLKRTALMGVLFLVLSGFSWASVVTLKNGDRISGDIMENSTDSLKIKTEAAGIISLDKGLVDSVMTNDEARLKSDADKKALTDAQQEAIEAAKAQAVADAKAQEQAAAQAAAASTPVPAPKVLKNDVSAGYNTTNGNTKTSAINFADHIQYKKGSNDWDIKTSYNYGSDKGRMTTQKAYGKAESDYRLGGAESKWFNSRSIEVDHDKFSAIAYRILPQIGIGYWFWEGEESKFEIDNGIGYEYTHYNTPGTKATGNMVDVPHLYIDKTLFWKLKLSQDLTLYPSLAKFSDYRLRSETDLVYPLTNLLSWKIGFVDEFNTTPRGGAKKNDTTLTSSLQYSF